MDTNFATFKPIEPVELNSSPSREEIANYYAQNNLTTDNDYLDKFFNIPAPAEKSQPIDIPVTYNIRELLKYPAREKKNTVVSNGTDKSNAGKYIINYFVNKGLSKEQAAGIAGNLHAESGFNTEIWGDNGTSFGLAQWRADRLVNLKNFARTKNKSASDFDTQLDFLWEELQTTENKAFNKLLTTRTPGQAARVFAEDFERMKEYSTNRETYANNFYQQ